MDYYFTDYEGLYSKFHLEIPGKCNLGEILCNIHAKGQRKNKLAMIFEDEKGEKYERVEDVFDCWYESGSMPFAAAHYPFDSAQGEPCEPLGGFFKRRR